jgi:outer membrane lipoprotein carrier protein
VRSSSDRPRIEAPSALRALLLVAAALVTLGNGAAEPSVDKLLAAIQKRYESVKDIRASFEQEAKVASIGKTEKSSGQVAIQRPGRMRWEYSAPDRRIVALDGEVIRMYLPEEGQLQIAPLEPGAFPPTALEFLLGSGDLAKSFSAEPLREEGRADLGLRLKPKQDASFEHIDLWVARDGYQLRESVVVDLFGNRTSVRFSDVKENAGISAETFNVEVPEGTETIDLRTGR